MHQDHFLDVNNPPPAPNEPTIEIRALNFVSLAGRLSLVGQLDGGRILPGSISHHRKRRGRERPQPDRRHGRASRVGKSQTGIPHQPTRIEDLLSIQSPQTRRPQLERTPLPEPIPDGTVERRVEARIHHQPTSQRN